MVLEHKRQPITVNIFHTLFIRLADGIAQDTRIVPAQYRTLDACTRYGTGLGLSREPISMSIFRFRLRWCPRMVRISRISVTFLHMHF